MTHTPRPAPHRRPPAALLALVLLTAGLAGCAQKIQPATDRFATAVATTTHAEDSLFAAIAARKITAERVCLALAGHIRITARRMEPANSPCAPTDADHGPDGIARARHAVDTILAPLDAYAEALRALAGTTASTTLNGNIDRLSKSVTGFDTKVLTPLRVPGVSQAALTRAGHAAKQIGDALVTIEAARDVNAAARAVSKPLARIAAVLHDVNRSWTETMPGELSEFIKGDIIALWPHASYTERQTLYDAWRNAARPIPAEPADDALTNLVDANDAVAKAGPVAAAGRIEHALVTAGRARAFYAALTSR